MIEFIGGDLLESDAQALVNTVNIFGVMGRGIALAFKQKYPLMFIEYKNRCNRKEVQVGKMDIHSIEDDRFIVNFPTKKHWRNPSKIRWIQDGLVDLVNFVRKNKIESIAIPALGCSNGGLNFDEVKPMIEVACNYLPEYTKSFIYLPKE